MPETENPPIYKTTRLLQIIVFSVVLLYFGRALFIPLSFGLLVAIIAYPVCKFLESRGWPRTIAASTLIIITVLAFGALFWLLIYELNLIVDDLPLIEKRIQAYYGDFRVWLNSSFGIAQEVQDNVLDKFISGAEGRAGAILSGAISATSSTAVSLFLIPVFAALFLFHRATFVKAVGMLAGKAHQEKISLILQESIISYYKFVRGTFFVYCIVGVLNTIGLLLLGIEHALLFGMVTAFMTIIPYVGIIISAALPVTVALITKDSIWYSVGVVLTFSVVQYLEANLIFPKVVGKQLGLSTWAVIVAMIIGTLLWGLAGMILFTPFAAMLKIFSDHIEGLKIVNVLLNRDAAGKT